MGVCTITKNDKTPTKNKEIIQCDNASKKQKQKLLLAKFIVITIMNYKLAGEVDCFRLTLT